MSQKATKVVVELYLRAVTCPGVFLPDKDDIYLSVSIMRNYKQSECLSRVFPLLFREKMRFEKVFKQISDPAAVAELLEYETVKFELVQLIPPAGETLAFFEEDARSFLFPEPRLVPSFSGVDREVLMTRVDTFPGIAPRIEFSTRTTIFECSARLETSINPNLPMKTVLRRMNSKKFRKRACKEPGGSCAVRKRAPRSRGLGTPPRSHSMSPSAIGHMNTKRLAQLQLGTHSPKSNLRDSAPQFEMNGAPSANSWKIAKQSHSTDWALDGGDDESLSDTDDLLAFTTRHRERHTLPEPERAPRLSDLRTSDLIRSRSSLWEEIHERVRGLLTTSRAMHRLAQGATDAEIDDVLGKRSL